MQCQNIVVPVSSLLQPSSFDGNGYDEWIRALLLLHSLCFFFGRSILNVVVHMLQSHPPVPVG